MRESEVLMRFLLPLTKLITATTFFFSMTSTTASLYSSETLQAYLENSDKQAITCLTVLNINTQMQSINLDDLIKKILTINADVICLQEVFDREVVYRFYESLKDQYDHFYFPIDVSGACTTGLFIASKYDMGNAKLTPIPTQNHPIDKSLFDCILLDGTAPLGHLYITLLSNRIAASGLNKIAEKMPADFIATEKEDLPFLLRENLGPLQEEQNIVDSYFLNMSSVEGMSHILFRHLTHFFSTQIDHKHTLVCSQIYAENRIIGLLTTIRKNDANERIYRS